MDQIISSLLSHIQDTFSYHLDFISHRIYLQIKNYISKYFVILTLYFTLA